MMAQEKTLTLQDLIPGGKNQKKFVPEDRPLLWVGDDMYLDAEGRETLAAPGRAVIRRYGSRARR